MEARPFSIFIAVKSFMTKSSGVSTITHLKNMDQGSGQGAGRLKSGAYTVVFEHFESSRNTAMDP
jgi:hypothetical protein